MAGGGSLQEKSVLSLEKEIMRLQEVLKDRESEIALLEESLKENQQQSPLEQMHGRLASDREELLEETPSTGRATPIVGSSDPLSPRMMGQFNAIRHSMQTDQTDHFVNGSVSPDSDGSLERLNELMRFAMICV
jgi:hypothetical protein